MTTKTILCSAHSLVIDLLNGEDPLPAAAVTALNALTAGRAVAHHPAMEDEAYDSFGFDDLDERLDTLVQSGAGTLADPYSAWRLYRMDGGERLVIGFVTCLAGRATWARIDLKVGEGE